MKYDGGRLHQLPGAVWLQSVAPLESGVHRGPEMRLATLPGDSQPEAEYMPAINLPLPADFRVAKTERTIHASTYWNFLASARPVS